jgi:hypothetical protein
MSTTNTGITIKTKKPVYSPKDVIFFLRKFPPSKSLFI